MTKRGNKSEEKEAIQRTPQGELEIKNWSDAVDGAVESCQLATIADMAPLQMAIARAAGLKQLKALLSREVVEDVFMPLQGSHLGFRTDRDKPKDNGPDHYPWEDVRDVMISALLHGFRPVGNEVNIIAGNAYFTKEGMERRVKEFPGLTDFELMAEIPRQISEGGAVVTVRATWKLNGIPDRYDAALMKDADGERDLRIPVKMNRGMGLDAVAGKAERKFLARVLGRLQGRSIPDGDVGDADAITTAGESATSKKVAALMDKHTRGGGTHDAPPQLDAPRQREPGEEG